MNKNDDCFVVGNQKLNPLHKVVHTSQHKISRCGNLCSTQSQWPASSVSIAVSFSVNISFVVQTQNELSLLGISQHIKFKFLRELQCLCTIHIGIAQLYCLFNNPGDVIHVCLISVGKDTMEVWLNDEKVEVTVTKIVSTLENFKYDTYMTSWYILLKFHIMSSKQNFPC